MKDRIKIFSGDIQAIGRDVNSFLERSENIKIKDIKLIPSTPKDPSIVMIWYTTDLSEDTPSFYTSTSSYTPF